MSRTSSRCFIVEVNGVQYVVKFGKIDEFLCLFLPSVVIIQSMTHRLYLGNMIINGISVFNFCL